MTKWTYNYIKIIIYSKLYKIIYKEYIYIYGHVSQIKNIFKNYKKNVIIFLNFKYLTHYIHTHIYENILNLFKIILQIFIKYIIYF